MFNWFRKERNTQQPVLVDMHSHLLAELDDGVKSLEEAERIILHFRQMGFKKLITTPHIMSDVYRNTPAGINAKLSLLKAHLASKEIDVEVSAAAEYYLDEALMKMIDENEPLLTFGDNYLLFETNFLSSPYFLKDFIFKAITKGYRLILAHPERYLYLQEDLSKAEDLIDRGVYFQLNLSSLTGYYSKQVQQLAFKLIDRGWIHFIGSDCHNFQQAQVLQTAVTTKYFRKVTNLPLLNNTL